MANRLVGSVRRVDTVARFGGDEFVINLTEIGANMAEATAQSRLVVEKVRTTLDKPYVLAPPARGQHREICGASLYGKCGSDRIHR